MENTKVVAVQSQARCFITAITGCYACLLGVKVSIVYHSTEKETKADITQHQIAICTKNGKPSEMDYYLILQKYLQHALSPDPEGSPNSSFTACSTKSSTLKFNAAFPTTTHRTSAKQKMYLSKHSNGYTRSFMPFPRSSLT